MSRRIQTVALKFFNEFEIPPDEQKEIMGDVLSNLPQILARCIWHSIIRWKEKQNQGAYVITNHIKRANPLIPHEIIKYVRNFLVGIRKPEIKDIPWGLEIKQDALFIDNFRARKTKEAALVETMDAIAKKYLQMQQEDRGWLSAFTRQYHQMVWERFKQEYNVKHPNAEKAGYGPGALIVYRK